MAYSKFKQIKEQDAFISDARADSDNAFSNSLSYKFSFGKYAGIPITSIPASYLSWLRKSACINVAEKCSQELERRERIHHNSVHNALLRAAQVP